MDTQNQTQKEQQQQQQQQQQSQADKAFIPTENNPNISSERQFVLKLSNTFAVYNSNGDIRGGDDGLFVNDTRVLSELMLTFGGRAPSLLSGSVSSDNAVFTAHLTNQAAAAHRRRADARRRHPRRTQARAVRACAARKHRADELTARSHRPCRC